MRAPWATTARFTVAFDDPERSISNGTVIEHPQYGRGLVRSGSMFAPEYEAEFEDGSVRRFVRRAPDQRSPRS